MILGVGSIARFKAFVEDAAAAGFGGAEEEHGEAGLLDRREFPGDANAFGEDFGEPVYEIIGWSACTTKLQGWRVLAFLLRKE